MMSGEDDLRTYPGPEFLQPLVACLPCSGFRGGRSQLESANLHRQSIAMSQGAYLLGDVGTLRMDAVVDVGHYQLLSMRVPGLNQQVQQGHGVRPPGDGNQRPPRPQAQGCQFFPKITDQGHDRSLTRLE